VTGRKTALPVTLPEKEAITRPSAWGDGVLRSKCHLGYVRPDSYGRLMDFGKQ
jgi:hypothetical protein